MECSISAVIGQVPLLGRREYFCCVRGGRWVVSGGKTRGAICPLMFSICRSICPSCPPTLLVLMFLPISTREGSEGVPRAHSSEVAAVCGGRL